MTRYGLATRCLTNSANLPCALTTGLEPANRPADNRVLWPLSYASMVPVLGREVETRGVEPLTSAMRKQRATTCATPPWLGQPESTQFSPVLPGRRVHSTFGLACARGESNPDAFRHTGLGRACLPEFHHERVVPTTGFEPVASPL